MKTILIDLLPLIGALHEQRAGVDANDDYVLGCRELSAPGGENEDLFDDAFAEEMRNTLSSVDFEQLLESCANDIAQMLVQVAKDMQNCDLPAIRRQFYKLAGLLGQFSYTGLAESLWHLEAATPEDLAPYKIRPVIDA